MENQDLKTGIAMILGALLFLAGGIVGIAIHPTMTFEETKNELDVIHENHRYNIQLPEEFMFADESDSLRAYTRNDTLFVWYN